MFIYVLNTFWICLHMHFYEAFPGGGIMWTQELTSGLCLFNFRTFVCLNHEFFSSNAVHARLDWSLGNVIDIDLFHFHFPAFIRSF